MFAMFIWVFVVLHAGIVLRLYFALRGPGVSRPVRWGLCLLAAACSVAFPAGRWVVGNGFWVTAMTFTGTFCLSVMLHAIMLWVLVDVFRLLNYFFRWFSIPPDRRVAWRHWCCAGIAGGALLLSGAGWVNTQFPVVREARLAAPVGTAPLRIVLVSDTHLGRLASPVFFGKLVDQIASLSPDLVLFAGDILEYDFDPADVPANAAALQRLKPRLGVWGVLGNHEHIGGKGGLNKRLLTEMGFRILVDEWAEIGEADGERILLVGRNDLSAGRFGGRGRKALKAVLADAPQDGRLKILLDHQPYYLEEAEAAGIYLQVSGHTHNGQLFPANLLVAALFENAHGYSRRGDTHYWVTSGAGTWGPRVRTSGRTEIVQIDLVPQQASALP